MRKSKVYIPSDEEFREIVANSYSYSDILRTLGLGTKGGSSTDILKRRIKELNCSVDHFRQSASNVHVQYALNDILVENSTYHNISCLKKRLIDNHLLSYECAICGISTWQGQPLSLQLDHINGINNDHRLNNLRLLCPNCHSQTTTYSGKNK